MNAADKIILAGVLLAAGSYAANLGSLAIQDVSNGDEPVYVDFQAHNEAHGEIVLFLLTLIGVGWVGRAIAAS